MGVKPSWARYWRRVRKSSHSFSSSLSVHRSEGACLFVDASAPQFDQLKALLIAKLALHFLIEKRGVLILDHLQPASESAVRLMRVVDGARAFGFDSFISIRARSHPFYLTDIGWFLRKVSMPRRLGTTNGNLSVALV